LDQSKIEELDNYTGAGVAAINSSFYARRVGVRKRKSTQYEEYENSPEGSSEGEEEHKPKRRVIRSNQAS
jgi:hypothetical protein